MQIRPSPAAAETARLAKKRIHNSFFLAEAAESSLPMTMRRPEEMSVGAWLMKDMSLKTIVLIVAAAVSSHYRVNVVAAKAEDAHRRLDVQRDLLKDKVDQKTYDAGMLQLSNQLAGIQLSVNTIQAALMKPPSQ